MDDTNLAQIPPYTTIDFATLAQKNQAFKQIYDSSSSQLDFQDPITILTLSQAILQSDFNLTLSLPGDRLCPPIPNRWNYVSWIQHLLDSTSPSYSNTYDPSRRVVGLDIGTGASAIYTMLCLRSRPNWTMCATDIDKKSFDSAVRNLTVNGLVTWTKMLQTIPENSLIPLRALGVEKLDFTICNPPFFTDAKDMHASLKGEGKSSQPNAVCTGAKVEMVCPGGDLGFVTRMVEESLVLRDKVTWYTSMLGKLESAKAVIKLLQRHGIDNWAVGVIDVGAGGGTKRWVVAWSFGDLRPRQSVARIEKIANEYLPFPTEYRIEMPEGVDVEVAAEKVDGQLKGLDLRWERDKKRLVGIGEAGEVVWNRAYRRVLEKRRKQATEMGQEGEKKVVFAFRVKVLREERVVVVEWLRGKDQVIWESFCGMLHRVFKKF
ncbi:hypothetical protein CC80DRAFT_518858 [Byssothecium circinans]|uniref:U6 small nuclear RNA (adenine-(43)-N(6))-methyltransferase n=1 Tax=Byssothecium circinans TaxID=147558 RepID=A0A6A5TKY9_9PLEO|nr:hypothetical protein CC80DRAFT_518858 [Byssothecium circinans]